MTCIMDKRLRRAPYAEWVLMYRLGLSRKRIADLVSAEAASVGYHLVIARRRDPELEAAHLAAASTKAGPPAELGRMDEIIAWVKANGRHPRERSEAAKGTLYPVYRDGLAGVPGWDRSYRTAQDVARWHDRLEQLAIFRVEGNDWPRHRKFTSDVEHTLGVWIHAQRQKHHRDELDLEKVRLLDDALPGWQTGRTRGRPPSGKRPAITRWP